MEETRLEGPREGTALGEISRDASSRKRFLKLVGGTGAASALAILVAACGDDEETSGTTGGTETTQDTSTGESTQADNGDVEIVNYALTLEYLEADFYQQVLDSGEIKDKMIGELAKSIGQNEQEHVETLIKTVESLGGTPAEQPKTKFEDVLASGPEGILKAAAEVENLGAAAYLGQAGLIKDPMILAAALSIHSVEARHAAALNYLTKNDSFVPDGAFAKPMDMDAVLEAVKPFIAS